MAVKSVRTLLRRVGLDVVRLSEPSSEALDRLRLIREHGIDLVVDVGANRGQYASALRRAGYRGRIVSFEPLSRAYTGLTTAAGNDDLWETRHAAVAADARRATLHVSENTWSSSLLPIANRHVESAPTAATVGEEEVEVVTLGTLDEELGGRRIMLKVDVQGGELAVLEGSGALLGRVRIVDVELSLVPMYDSQPLLPELLTWLSDRRFEPIALDPEFREPQTGVLLQLNGLFVRTGR
jgi:FkbM family methyltransferase